MEPYPICRVPAFAFYRYKPRQKGRETKAGIRKTKQVYHNPTDNESVPWTRCHKGRCKSQTIIWTFLSISLTLLYPRMSITCCFHIRQVFWLVPYQSPSQVGFSSIANASPRQWHKAWLIACYGTHSSGSAEDSHLFPSWLVRCKEHPKNRMRLQRYCFFLNCANIWAIFLQIYC